MSHAFFTPLRYPGGKGKLAEYLKAIITSNELEGGCYVEPYAGGAAVALELLLLGYVDEIHINDLNRGVHAFWNAVVNDAAEFIDRIHLTPITMEEWFRQKSIQMNPGATGLDLGFSTFFLNRCNRSGILKGGVIGGKEQHGKWKIDARFNKLDLITRIRQIHRFRDQIILHNRDAAELVTELSTTLPENTLFYLDPPYYVKGKGLYDNFYDHSDHFAVAELMKSVSRAQWIVSYDDVSQIRLMYSPFRSLSYKLSYSAQTREQGGEIMFFCDSLVIPEIPKNAPMHLAA